jgi:phosphoribosylamine--glycine ligase
VVAPRLQGDLLEALALTADGRLDQASLGVTPDACVSIVLAAAGYPEAPVPGAEIEGIERAAELDEVTVLHAGTARDDAGRLVVAGGRVLNVSAVAADLASARDRAYEAAHRISFEGMQLRSDIGEVALV